MMRIATLLLALLLSLASSASFAQGWLAGTPPADLGVKDGRLKPPSATSNSVSSQAHRYAGPGAEYAQIAPLAFRGDPAAAMRRLGEVVTAMPGATVIRSTPDYLYAEFSTRYLGFVDDAEFLLAPSEGVIHLRSASRLGSQDFGANRERIEALRSRFSTP
ncbi:MAG: DUF1499 domain-containing protein [Burkholderiaceae bacterium]